mmetsp:Transcript_10242/g.17183  ORF Transcript_10242/g.17183 Transcript_10242/m.17183 type:complete len:167 (-) Transcript_10242:635-1135(-)
MKKDSPALSPDFLHLCIALLDEALDSITDTTGGGDLNESERDSLCVVLLSSWLYSTTTAPTETAPTTLLDSTSWRRNIRHHDTHAAATNALNNDCTTTTTELWRNQQVVELVPRTFQMPTWLDEDTQIIHTCDILESNIEQDEDDDDDNDDDWSLDSSFSVDTEIE